VNIVRNRSSTCFGKRACRWPRCLTQGSRFLVVKQRSSYYTRSARTSRRSPRLTRRTDDSQDDCSTFAPASRLRGWYGSSSVDDGTSASADMESSVSENSPSWVPKKLLQGVFVNNGTPDDRSTGGVVLTYLLIIRLIRLIFFTSNGSASFFSLPL
jgi:hypothetical protein